MKRTIILAAAFVVAAGLAVTALAGCGGTKQSGTVTITIKDLRFNPEKVTIAEGTKVRWVNEDTTAHTSTSADFSADATTQPAGAWSSTIMDPGQSWERTFDTAGDYPYACSIHPYIKGTVEVTKK